LNKLKYLREQVRAIEKTNDFRGFIKRKTCSGEMLGFGIISLNPSIVFKELIEAEKPRSVILTSGTLSPFKLFSSELKTQFDVTLENSHVIEEGRVLARIIDKDFYGRELKFNFETHVNSRE
jgi:hypothetical protein